jgi:hypothetical protein
MKILVREFLEKERISNGNNHLEPAKGPIWTKQKERGNRKGVSLGINSGTKSKY